MTKMQPPFYFVSLAQWHESVRVKPVAELPDQSLEYMSANGRHAIAPAKRWSKVNGRRLEVWA